MDPGKRVQEAGVADRVSLEVAGAQTPTSRGVDLVTTFDCVHDMGDPLGAATTIREALAKDGSWMIVEPAAGESAIRQVVTDAGFTRFRRIAETPFNHVYEARI